MLRMIAFRTRALALLAMLVLLAGTATPALARMTCVANGHVVLNVGQVEDCCPEQDQQGPTVSATCCELDGVVPQRMDFTGGLHISVPAPVAVMPARPAQWLAPGFLAGHPYAPNNGAPDLPGSQLLPVSGVFRI